MDDSKKTKQNVVGIGDNNTYSKEQYAKIVRSFHHMCKFARQEVERIREMHDSAFTGYWKGYGDKLKTHEKHEQRLEAVNLQDKFSKQCQEEIADLEAKATAQGIEIPNRETEKEEDKSDN